MTRFSFAVKKVLHQPQLDCSFLLRTGCLNTKSSSPLSRLARYECVPRGVL